MTLPEQIHPLLVVVGMMQLPEQIHPLVVIVGVLLILIGVPVYLLTGGLRRFALPPLQREFSDLALRQTPQPGDVTVVYHTYRGFLLWCAQSEHRFAAPPAEALLALKRLLRFNLTWGMLSYGMVFIPFLAIGNYFAQKRSIERQVRGLQK
jgi:hypothetical protein